MAGGFPWPYPITSQPWHLLTNATNTDCEAENHWERVLEMTVLISAGCICLLLNVLSLIISRELAVPINFLGSTPYRLVCCSVMTLWSADVFHDLTVGHNYFRDRRNGVLDSVNIFSVSPTVIFLREALIYFPVLACVDFTLPCLGHCLGCFYTILMTGYKVYVEAVVLRGCSSRGQLTGRETAFSLLAEVPVFMGYVGVALWFFFKGAMETTLVLFARKPLKRSKCCSQESFSDEVRSLLRSGGRSQWSWRGRSKRNLVNYASLGFQYVLPFRRSFRYPLSFLAALSMSWIAIYILFLWLVLREWELTDQLVTFVNSFNITVKELSRIAAFFPNSTLPAQLHDFFYDAQSFAEAYRVILPFSACIATGVYLFFVLYLIQNFHKRLKRAARGDIAFLVESEPLPSKAYILAAGMKYCAFQMIYILCSWIVYNLMVVALLSLGLIFYYLFKDFMHFAIYLWSFFMIPMIWSALLHHLQLFLNKYVFLRKADGDMIHIRFRSVYLFLTYLLFFFNVIFGAVLSYLRVFASFMFTVVMYMRIDWDVYMRGLEGWDFGHRTYVGFMYLEYTRNNAVLRTFLQLLSDQLKQSKDAWLLVPRHHTIQREESTSSIASASSSGTVDQLLPNGTSLRRCASIRNQTTRAGKSKRARNLWLVAYTLIHNPQLSSLTASSLRSATNLN